MVKDRDLDPPGYCRICGRDSRDGVCKACREETRRQIAEERADRIRDGEDR